MIFGKIIYMEKGKGNSDRARIILMENFGLVVPKNDPFGRTERDVLVWEDETGIGRYRVHFYDHIERKLDYEAIQFKYWLNSRMKREIFERDPMSLAINGVRQSISGNFFERELTKDISIDQVLQSYHE